VLARDLRAAWERHGCSSFSTEFWIVSTYRFGRWSNEQKNPWRYLLSKLYGVLAFWVLITTGSTVAREARIGAGLHVVHGGNIRIHPSAVLGERVGLMHDVTIGTNMERVGAPTLGDDVFVGAGAKILGPVRIGAGARVAANSLVLCDVPDGATAIGVPARVLRYTGRATPVNGVERSSDPAELSVCPKDVPLKTA
jgi:serine O-acetyltransferase